MMARHHPVPMGRPAGAGRVDRDDWRLTLPAPFPGPAAEAARGNRLPGIALALSVVAVIAAVAALVVALAGKGPTADASPCQAAAWSATPSAQALGPQWSVHTPTLFAEGIGFELDGPAAADGSGSQVVYVSVSCYPTAAHEFVVRSHAAAKATGSTDAAFPTLGDETVATQATSTADLTIIIRRGTLVATLEVPSPIDTAQLEQLGRAQDAAMGGPAAPSPAPIPSTPLASGSIAPGASGSPAPNASANPSANPSEALSHDVPALEALLPATIGGLALQRDSLTGDVLGSDTQLAANIVKLGKKAADLQLAEAFDPDQFQFYAAAFRLPGVSGTALLAAIVGSEAAPVPSGATSTTVTLGGTTVTKIDPGDGSGLTYAFAKGDVAYVANSTNQTMIETFVTGTH